MEKQLLYSALTRFGAVYCLDPYDDPNKFLTNIKPFSEKWVQYNRRKDIRRYGLSITSLDGGFSGIPDLDSIREYNIANGTSLTELDFRTPTDVYQYIINWVGFLEGNICRTHVLKLQPGGFFPIHRDNGTLSINSFRLFIPLINCNPPNTYFILDGKPIQFEHGYIYFIDTCIEHLFFNASIKDSYSIVVNVELTQENVTRVLEQKRVK